MAAGPPPGVSDIVWCPCVCCRAVTLARVSQPLVGPAAELDECGIDRFSVRLKEDRRRRARKRAELVDHVGLIVEADVRGDRRPLRDVGREQRVDERLKARDPREELWRQTGRGAEAAAELLTAESVGGRHLLDR